MVLGVETLKDQELALADTHTLQALARWLLSRKELTQDERDLYNRTMRELDARVRQ